MQLRKKMHEKERTPLPIVKKARLEKESMMRSKGRKDYIQGERRDLKREKVNSYALFYSLTSLEVVSHLLTLR